MNMKKILTILAAFLCTFGTNAQTPLAGSTEENPTEITLGECYLLPQDFSNAYFTFRSETDGVLYLNLSKPLRIFGQGGPLPLFDKQCVQGIEAGKTYTFHNNSTWGDSITMTPSFTEGKPYLPVALTSTSPADGSTYRTTLHDGDITFAFNTAIDAAAVTAEIVLENGEHTSINSYRTSEDYNTQGTNYVLQLAETYNTLTESGKLKEGDTFKVTLTGIASITHPQNVYEGAVTLTLKAAGKAVRLESVSKQGTLQSYYMPGDEAGLITLTFTAPVTCKAPNATLAYGDREAGTWTEVAVPYTIDGNTITWNVQGILLTNVPADNEGNRYVSISLKEIYDLSGSPIESNTIGTTGTILFTYLVETMDINIYPDFLPAAGSNIDPTQEVEIWISAGVYLTFDGAQVTYQKGGQSVTESIPLNALRQEADPYSETDLLVYVPISSYPFEAGEVTIELTGVAAANGTSPEIKVTYKSEGSRASTLRPLAGEPDKVAATWRTDGTPVAHPSEKGIYIQRMADGKVRKLSITH